jgi:putative ABC transport system ATP-binding protein
MEAKPGSPEAASEVVRLEKITKIYRKGATEVKVLNGIDSVIFKGEFVAIMGSSGSGKSTLLNILGLLDIPTSGIYLLDGKPVRHHSDNMLADLRKSRIGFIFQSFNLISHLNVEQNIELALVYAEIPKRERRLRAAELADRVGLGHRLKHRPNQLSGGECQRIAIARSLANRPSFLLADEPTGNLDEKTGGEIMKLFHELHETGNATIVMVTHNIDYEAHFDRIIHLRDGTVDSVYHV